MENGNRQPGESPEFEQPSLHNTLLSLKMNTEILISHPRDIRGCCENSTGD